MSPTWGVGYRALGYEMEKRTSASKKFLKWRISQADTGEFRGREQAEWNLPAGRHVLNASEVVMKHAGIVSGNVGKLRAALLLHRPPKRRARSSQAAH